MKNKTKGILLLIGPIMLLVLTLSLWAISKFVLVNLQENQSQIMIQTDTNGAMFGDENQASVLQKKDLRSTISASISVVLGLIGILAVIGIIVGIPLGIYFLSSI